MNFSLPSGLTTGNTFARVRLSSDGNLNARGPAADGEVEDYVVNILAPPTVTQVVVNGGDMQRSSLKTLTVIFDRVVNVDQASGDPFQFINTGTNQPVTEIPVISDDGVRTTVEFTFAPGASVADWGSLLDGNYRLTINSALVTSFGAALDGDGNGTTGGNYVFGATAMDKFYRKYGDVNGNGIVDLLDFADFRRAFGKASSDSGYIESLDSDGDMMIGLLDFAAFRRNFGT